MKTVAALIIAGVMVANGAMASESEAYKKNDFAYGIDISPEAGHALHRLAVPRDVYRNAVRDDLGDLRIFNADGEMVPYAVRRYTPAPGLQGKRQARTLTAIYGRKGQQPGDVQLRYRRSGQDTVFEVYNSNKPAMAAKDRPLFYVVSIDDFDRAISKLTLRWSNAQRSFIDKVLIEASDDLTHWRQVSRDGVIAQFDYGGQVTQHGEIELGHTRAKFLKISLQSRDVQLTQVELVETLREAPREYQWLQLAATRGGEGEYLFDTGGRMPVERVRVLLPEGNNVLNARLSSRASSENAWRHRGLGVVYRLLSNGNTFTSDEIRTYRFTDRHLRLQIAKAESVLGSRLPQIEIGWQPDRIVFVSRGNGPFTLAYGNTEAGPEFHPIGQILSLANGEGKVVPQPAKAGDPYALGGAARLKPERELPWKQWTLWGVLLIGVALMAWMASRLAKQLKTSNN